MNTPTKPTRGERNNNPGNIRRSPICWRGEVPGSDPEFECFDSPESGIRATAKLLKHYISEGFDTPKKIIHRYAPPVENDTGAYLAAVCRDTGFAPDQELRADVATLTLLTRAIIRHENGRVIYSETTIAKGVAAA